jgi:hypothetical protein
MPKIAQLKEINGECWARLEMPEGERWLGLYSVAEMKAIEKYIVK